jgi:hypothetical protein
MIRTLETLAQFAKACQKPDVMMGWLTIIRTIGGYIAAVAASVFMAWLGLSQLYRWYTTGELLASFRGMDNLTKWQLITYETHPFNFVSLFAVYVVVAAVGLAACAGLYLRIRAWWGNKPKPTTE